MAVVIVTREQVMDKLLAVLSQAGDFKLVSRRNRNPETIKRDQTPALMLLEHSDSYRNPSTHAPSIRRLLARAIVYCDVGGDENAVPASFVNDALDAFDRLLKPDNMQTGQCTLGGLVSSAIIDGTVIKAPGDITGKSLAVVPINILLP